MGVPEQGVPATQAPTKSPTVQTPAPTAAPTMAQVPAPTPAPTVLQTQNSQAVIQETTAAASGASRLSSGLLFAFAVNLPAFLRNVVVCSVATARDSVALIAGNSSRDAVSSGAIRQNVLFAAGVAAAEAAGYFHGKNGPVINDSLRDGGGTYIPR